MDVCQKQRCVIEFLNAEEVPPIDFHKHLMNVCCVETVDGSTVGRWVRRFHSGDRDVIDKPSSGRTSIATSEENEARLDKLIESNRRTTVNGMSAELVVSVVSVKKLIFSLGYSKSVQDLLHECYTNAHSGIKRSRSVRSCWNDMKSEAMLSWPSCHW